MALPQTAPQTQQRPDEPEVAALAREVEPLAIRPLSRREYDALVAHGLLVDERVELLDGFIVTMSPQGPPHASTTWRIARLLTRALDDEGLAIVRQHSALALSEKSEPEPDVAAVPVADYSQRHPGTAYLVVEVADSSLRKDRTTKARIYARAGIPEYWIVNVDARVVEVYTDPDPAEGRDRARADREPGATISLVSFPDAAFPVEALLPNP